MKKVRHHKRLLETREALAARLYHLSTILGVRGFKAYLNETHGHRTHGGGSYKVVWLLGPWQGRLAVKLVRELLLLRHDVRMGPGRLGQAFIQVQRTRAHFGARLIRHFQELLLGVWVKTWGGRDHRGDRTIGALGSRRFDFRLLHRRAGSQNQRCGNDDGPKHPSAYAAEPWEVRDPDANPLLHSHFSL